jgi:hypothetical protein
MNSIRQSPVLPWIIAVVGFPIGGFLGHLVAGPAATVPAAAGSGVIAGAIVGLAQALALRLNARLVAAWVAVTGLGLGIALSVLTAATGLIENPTEAVALGALSGVAIGAAQAAILVRERIANAWLWIPATGVAWAVGWLVTSSIGVALEAGWPVFGLSGAIVCQIITGIVVWRVVRERVAVAA